MFLNNIHAPTHNIEPNAILLPDGQTYLQTVLNTFSNVYAIYPLNETSGITAEETINNFDGTYNGPTLNSIAGPGASMGNAAFYDGLVDYCQLPAASLDGPFDPNLGTMMIWLKVFNAGVWTDLTLRYGVIIAQGSSNRIAILKSSANNTIRCQVVAGGTNNPVDITISSTGWNCFGLTWNKTENRIRAYLNGTQQGIDIAYNGIWAGSLVNAGCQIGAFSGASFWHGYPSFLMLSSAEATAAQMAAGAIAA